MTESIIRSINLSRIWLSYGIGESGSAGLRPESGPFVDAKVLRIESSVALALSCLLVIMWYLAFGFIGYLAGAIPFSAGLLMMLGPVLSQKAISRHFRGIRRGRQVTVDSPE
jgi:hypothetical protein